MLSTSSSVFDDYGPTLWNSRPPTVRDPSLTLTQFFCALGDRAVLLSLRNTPRRLRSTDSSDCKDFFANANLLTYLLTYCVPGSE